MITSKEINCAFNDEAQLLISQENNGNIWLETDSTIYGAEAFENPFCIFNPQKSDLHKSIYPFFKRLIDENDTNAPPAQKPTGGEEHVIKQSGLQHGLTSKLSLRFAHSNLIGIRAGSHSGSTYNNPMIWISPADDAITRAMKKSIVTL